MPTNLYGENDNFLPENSHVISALIKRFHEVKLNGCKEVIAWGGGEPMRELLVLMMILILMSLNQMARLGN
ncbi:MAG: GDP-L-fucose synthase [Oleiphilaceae bacterium]|jgi:GDP-L-fucose synthase